MTSANVLEVDGLTMAFGGLKAVDGLSLAVRANQCFGIIGANGAGKTTLLNLLTGYLKPTAGSIRLDGDDVTQRRPSALARAGIGRTFQITQPFAEMTVAENVMTGALFSRNGRTRSLAQARDFCQGPLTTVGLAAQADVPAGALTLGAKKKLELARVLATEPRVMLLDEVMGGLTGGEVDDITNVLEGIKNSGTVTIVMVEHLVHVITYLSDHVAVLDFGRLLFQGRPEAVIDHPDVIRAYLGAPV